MQKGNLITTLKELGFSGSETKDLLLYTLNTKDRQEQMQTWILANKGSCDKESIRQKAQEILRGFLASNPYNIAAKNMPAPKWEPPPPPKQKPADAAPKQAALVPPAKEKRSPAPEDTFDQLIDLFRNKLRT